MEVATATPSSITYVKRSARTAPRSGSVSLLEPRGHNSAPCSTTHFELRARAAHGQPGTRFGAAHGTSSITHGRSRTSRNGRIGRGSASQLEDPDAATVSGGSAAAAGRGGAGRAGGTLTEGPMRSTGVLTFVPDATFLPEVRSDRNEPGTNRERAERRPRPRGQLRSRTLRALRDNDATRTVRAFDLATVAVLLPSPP